ncbi:hypothetical protein SLITO_v1c04840 [Spiroplasma litorale]|uniref:Uncharacterized protein n=1 Tax=Spiroplasma litorale TaxID=216942 RepID=A0A0K1W208_9MOLU|nr:hypothetical protein [Spiroplasma litorale]AKX34137.1 hypothetical protein SLITO_v1c04840 [Spiroplasma litorale]
MTANDFLIIKNNFYNTLKNFYIKLKNSIYSGFHKNLLEEKFNKENKLNYYLIKIFNKYCLYNFLKKEYNKLEQIIESKEAYEKFNKIVNNNFKKNNFEEIIFFTLSKVNQTEKVSYENNINKLNIKNKNIFVRNLDNINKSFYNEYLNNKNSFIKLKKDFVNEYYKFDNDYYNIVNSFQLKEFQDERNKLWNVYFKELLNYFNEKNVDIKQFNNNFNFDKIKTLIKPNSLVVIDFNISKIFNYQNYFLNNLIFFKLLYNTNSTIITINNNYFCYLDLISKKNFNDLKSLITYINSNKRNINDNEFVTKNININTDILNRYLDIVLDNNEILDIKQKNEIKTEKIINKIKNVKINNVEEDLKIIDSFPIESILRNSDYKEFKQLISEITIEEDFNLVEYDSDVIKKTFEAFIKNFKKNVDNLKVEKESINYQKINEIKNFYRNMSITELYNYLKNNSKKINIKMSSKKLSHIEGLKIYELYNKIVSSIEKLNFI